MKKKLLLGLLIGTAPFMLAACGSKESAKEKKEKEEAAATKNITCTGDKEGKITLKVKYDTKAKTVTAGEMEYELDLSKYSETERTEIKKLNLCDSFKNDETYSGCKPINTDSAFGVDLTFNIDKLLENVSQSEKEVELDDFVKDLEDEMDVKCEVK